MKIAFLTPSTSLGGAEWSLLDLMASLRAHDPSLDLWFVTSEPGPLSARARDLGVSTAFVPMPSRLASAGDSAIRFGGPTAVLATLARAAAAVPSAWSWRAGLGRVLRSIAPDLIHTNDTKSHLMAAWIPGRRAPVVWHVRDFLGRRRVMSQALGASAKRVAGAIAISEAVARDARTVLGATPVATVHNAIDLERFTPAGERADLDALTGRPAAGPAAIRIGLVAAYARWKGHGLFLEAIERFVQADRDSPVRFYIVGGPIYRTAGSQFSEAELRQEAARRGVGDRVGFVRFQADVPRVYRALDVVVQASTEPEPFGRTIVEAMACERPVIASRAGGAAEIVTPGDDSLLFEPGEAGSLVEAMRALAADPEGRRRMGRRARATAESRFSRSRLGPQVLQAYERFVSSRRLQAKGRKDA